jgi:hypothetical protein
MRDIEAQQCANRTYIEEEIKLLELVQQGTKSSKVSPHSKNGTAVGSTANWRRSTANPLISLQMRFWQIVGVVQVAGQNRPILITGGEGEIRTPGTRKGTPAFEAGAIDHSATSPGQ